MVRASLAFACCLLMAGAASAAGGDAPAKERFGAIATPVPGAPAPIGGYARGCLAGAVRLSEDAADWQIMRPSRNRAWGHPEAAAYVARLGATARGLGWPGLAIGDVSQPRGGPMPSGHASHQIGLDIDIWLTRPRPEPMSRAERDRAAPVNQVSSDRRHVSSNWTESHAELLRAAARDPAVARIFVNAAIKAELCRWAPANDRAWLRRIRPWWGHDHHFHVRLACPEGATMCEDQAPPPPGDGCDETLAWWFSEEALNPPPPANPPKPRRALTMAELPAACADLADAP